MEDGPTPTEKKTEGEKSDTEVILKLGKVEADKKQRPSFLEFLAKLSPGKDLRTALDNMRAARDGALIVIDTPNLRSVCEGGFKINCRFTAQKLSELAKMDGAIILSNDLKRVLFANVLLVPDTRIPTDETGTRHMAAERTSKQLETPVIAVSERRRKITLFYENRQYVLQDSETLLRRAIENLHILEKQKEIFNELLTNLNILETTNLVSVGDICSLLQRTEIITRIMSTLKRHITELGKEGGIIQMRVRELSKGVEDIEKMVISDYLGKPPVVKRLLSRINFDGLLDQSALARLLFESSIDRQIFSKGYRILSKLNLTEREINDLIYHFKNLSNILNANDENLEIVLKHKTESYKKQLETLKEQIMIGKKI